MCNANSELSKNRTEKLIIPFKTTVNWLYVVFQQTVVRVYYILKDTLKAFGDFRNKQQKCMKECFLMSKIMFILKVYSIHYTLR